MAIAAERLGTEAILERARALRPPVESARDEMEAQRHMPASLVQAMTEARLFHLLVPESVGGLETDPLTCMRALEEVARQDGSAGWNLMIGVAYGLMSGYVPRAVAAQVYGAPTDVVAGTIAPNGKALAVKGGYRVSGRWSFGSGIHHASSVISGCQVFDGETPRMMAENVPFMRMVLVPVSDCEIHDEWHVSGLRGTGSEDYSMTDVFVPEERAFLPFFSPPHQDGPLYRMPATFFSSLLAPVPLGIAQAAIGSFVELATTKVPRRIGPQSALRDRVRVQLTVAKAETLVGSARAYLHECVQAMWEDAKAGTPISVERRASLRLASCNAASASAEAVDMMYHAGGGTSVYNSSLLQRCLRDVHAATQHAGFGPDNVEEAGRVLVGLRPTNPMF